MTHPIKITALALVAFAATGAATGCSQETSPAGETNDELIGGKVDSKNLFAVGVCGSEPNKDPAKGHLGVCVEAGTRCTGSLIAKNVVLTARHCVRKIKWGNDFCGSNFTDEPLTKAIPRVTLSDSVLDTSPRWRDVEEVIVPFTDSACGDDIALLVLRDNVEGVHPAKVDLETNLAVKHPAKVAVVGRGILTAEIDLKTLAPINEQEGNLQRRVLTGIPFLCASDTDLTCKVADATSPPSNSFSLTKGYFLFGPGTASGDSGSGILDDDSFAKGDPTIIGVNSAGTYDPKTGKGNAGLGVRVSLHKTLILGAMARGAAKGDYDLPDWAKFGDISP